MIELINKEQATALRKFFAHCKYTPQALTRTLGTSQPPGARQMQEVIHRTREANTRNTLIRLFLLGRSVENALARQLLPQPIVSLCLDLGLLQVREHQMYATVVVIPLDDMLFVSDAFSLLGTAQASEFVLPASTHSANFLRRLTLRTPFDNALDLGCGCGIHALFAARHAQQVIATDISARAIAYTQFNARLNGLNNIECRRGNLFDPVAGRKFDLIITNPPFVIGPDTHFEYRDNALELDEFCRLLVRNAPGYLESGGYLQMLCEWVEIQEQPWPTRLAEWVADVGCDAWILHSPPQDTASYVAQRSTDLRARRANSTPDGQDEAVGEDDTRQWLAYFDQHRVNAIHPGMIALRKREAPNWLQIQSNPGDIETDAGEAVANAIAACDFLDLCSDDETLLEASLGLSPKVKLEQQFSRDDGGWSTDTIMLRMTNGLIMDAQVDVPVMAFLNQLDGQSTLRECIARFAQATGATQDVAAITKQLLPAVRLFIGRGFVEPAESSA